MTKESEHAEGPSKEAIRIDGEYKTSDRIIMVAGLVRDRVVQPL